MRGVLGRAGFRLMLGSMSASSFITRTSLATAYGSALIVMCLGILGAAASPNIYAAVIAVAVSGAGNGMVVVSATRS
jgi:hypothetical protein